MQFLDIHPPTLLPLSFFVCPAVMMEADELLNVPVIGGLVKVSRGLPNTTPGH